MFENVRTKSAVSAAAVLAIVAVCGGAIGVVAISGLPNAAIAQTHEAGGRKGPSGGGHDDGGHEDGGEEEGGHSSGGNHGGSGGSGGNAGVGQGKGNSGQGAGGRQGSGGPVWSKEGIPEVELGRLNVVRSPDRVLDRALAEALASMTSEMKAFYSMPLDSIIMKLSTEFESAAFIDSPLQNLALFGELMGGSTALAEAGIRNSSTDLLAVFLGVASDKTIVVSSDTVKAVSIILGYNLNDVQAATLAQKAEAVRVAVLAGHG